MTSSYDESRFRRQVDAALVKVKTILDNTREPTYPADVSHKYDDKYMLVDFITNTSLASQLTCLELLGLTGEGFQQLKQWSVANRTITLRLKAESSCTFDREVTKDVESATKHVTEYKSGYTGSKWTATDKVVTKVTEYFWKYAATWVLFAYQGNDPETKIVFQQRSSSHELVTSTNSQPYPKVTVEPSIDLNISWLFTNLSDTFSLNFGINRQTKSCRTPRRNSDVETALSYFRSFHQWASSVQSYFNGKLFPVQTNHGLDMGKINDTDTFIPVVPLFEESADKKKAKESSEKTLASVAESNSECVLRTGDVNSFLVEQKRSLLEKHKEIETMFPDGGAKGKAKLISNQEAKLVVVVIHAQRVCQHYTDGVQYVEEMLRQQLISAIGKEVQATDFVNYMLYHNRVIFKGEFEPRPFCYAVRRPDHFPEGLVTIEATVGNANPEPIQTTVSHSRAIVPMNFPISAAVKVQFLGDRFLHGWVSQQFSGYSGVQLSLTARARQFSCFIMLVGTIASGTTFEPKHAIIIQNKDDLKIPLVLEQIPTPKAFSDAIESLSPEQQRFAKAYRQMQLANTLFGICLIQIKPQLEKLLNLPDDSLTKEIRLTQDLLELFLKYQIPSDLVSYEGSPKAEVQKKVDAVRGHVSAMQEMIKISKQNEIDEQKMVTAYAKASVFEDTSYALGAAVVRNTFENAAVERASAPTTGGAKTEEPQEVEKVDPNVIDYTKIPKRLDKSFRKFDEDNALHSTIIKTSGNWTKKSQKALLAEPTTNIVGADGQLDEKNKAYDLLDALSRSGVLGIDAAELHVVLAATHCFDATLINTLVQQNVNPIEKVERSTLIMAMEIHSKPASELLIGNHVERVLTYSPMLFDNKEKAAVKSLTA